jgi:hypothetical protein
MTQFQTLINMYDKWLSTNNLPQMAPEYILMHEKLTQKQEQWLNDYIANWDYQKDKINELKKEMV